MIGRGHHLRELWWETGNLGDLIEFEGRVGYHLRMEGRIEVVQDHPSKPERVHLLEPGAIAKGLQVAHGLCTWLDGMLSRES